MNIGHFQASSFESCVMTSPPIIHLNTLDSADESPRRRTIETLRMACVETGFLYLCSHAVSQEVIDRMRDSVIEVFSQSPSLKAQYRISRDNYRGYIPFGFFTPASSPDCADQYEGFKLHADVKADDPIRRQCPLYGPNRWPPRLAAAKMAVTGYWNALEKISEKLLRLFALALNKPETLFLPYFEKPLTGMTLLHYPAMPAGKRGFGIHPHKDSSAFTVLYPDPIGGLQIRTRQGEWIEADAPDGAFIVNIGDVMEHWTGGQFKSTPHRVINKTGQERYSFPYFATPRFDTVIAPVVDSVDGYNRPPLLMEAWYREIIASNWPDTKEIDPTFDPRIT